MSTKFTQMKPTTSDMKEELLKWICQRHATNGPLDRQLLREKALNLATSFGLTGFKCSDAWLTLFLKKYGFSPTLTNCNGPTFPDYRVWVDLLRSLITQYRHKDLFNVDQLVMYSDFVPSTIFPKKDTQQHGDQVTKPHTLSWSSQAKRIAILMCCNSSGTEKLGTLISGPYQPSDSRNDCHYHRDQSCSGITDDVFAEWLLRLNRDMAKSDRRILLLLNRDRVGASQKASQLSHVDLLYFPKDFPAHLRPLRGDVFHCIKMTYRSRFVRHLRSTEANKHWGVDDVLESMVQAWNAVSQELIVANFQRTRLRVDDSFLRIECPAWEDLGTGVSFKSFVTFDDHLSDNSSHPYDDPELMDAGNGHQYNLRNSGKGTVDLDDSDDPFDGRRRKKRSNGQSLGDTSRETFDQEFQSDADARSSSGLRRKMRNAKGQLTSEEEPTNSSDAQTPREGSKAQDFCEDVTPVENSAGEPLRSACDSFDDFANAPHELFEKTSVAVSQPDCEGTFQGRETRSEGRLRPESMKEINSNFKRDECGSQSLERDAPVLNFPGEAGPSREGACARAESSGRKSPPRPVAEFDDEEETQNARRLRLNVLDAAVERCDEIGTPDDAGNPGRSNDDNSGALKRSGGRVDGDQPAEKRPRVEDSWSKCYETNFVFGPELHASPTSQSVESLADDRQDTRNREPMTKSKKTQTRGGELEKRCIFTLDGSSSGVTFPATED